MSSFDAEIRSSCCASNRVRNLEGSFCAARIFTSFRRGDLSVRSPRAEFGHSVPKQMQQKEI